MTLPVLTTMGSVLLAWILGSIWRAALALVAEAESEGEDIMVWPDVHWAGWDGLDASKQANMILKHGFFSFPSLCNEESWLCTTRCSRMQYSLSYPLPRVSQYNFCMCSPVHQSFASMSEVFDCGRSLYSGSSNPSRAFLGPLGTG